MNIFNYSPTTVPFMCDIILSWSKCYWLVCRTCFIMISLCVRLRSPCILTSADCISLMVGKISRSRRLYTNSAGDFPHAKRVFLRIINPFKISSFEFLHFLMRFFTDFTVTSANPFDLGYRGLLVT